MHYTYKTGGTCSTMIDFDIIDGKLHNIVFTNGCNFFFFFIIRVRIEDFVLRQLFCLPSAVI